MILLQDGGVGSAGSFTSSFWVAPAQLAKVSIQFSAFVGQYGTLTVNFSPKSTTQILKVVFFSSSGLQGSLSTSSVTCNSISASAVLTTNLTITFYSAQTFSGDVSCALSNSFLLNQEMINTAVSVMTLSSSGSPIDSGTTSLTVTYNKLSSPSIIVTDSVKGKTSSLVFSFQYRLLPAIAIARVLISGLSGVSLSSTSAATCTGLYPSQSSIAINAGTLVVSFSSVASATSGFVQCSISRVTTSSSGTLQITIKVYDLFAQSPTGVTSGTLSVFPYALSNFMLQYVHVVKMEKPMIISFVSSSVAAVSSLVLSFSSTQLQISSTSSQVVQCTRGSGTFSISASSVSIAFSNPQSLYGSIVCTLAGVSFSTFGNYTDGIVSLQTFSSSSPDAASSQQAFHLDQNSVNLLRVYSALAVAGQSSDFTLEYSRGNAEQISFTVLQFGDLPSFVASSNVRVSCTGLIYDPPSISITSDQSHLNVSFSKSAILPQGATFFTCTISALKFAKASSSHLLGFIFGNGDSLVGAATSNAFNVSASSLTQVSLQVPPLLNMLTPDSGWRNLASVQSIISFTSSVSTLSSILVSFVSSIHNSFRFKPSVSTFYCNKGSGSLTSSASIIEFNVLKLSFSSYVAGSGSTVCTINGIFLEDTFQGSSLDIPIMISTTDSLGVTQASSNLFVANFYINAIRNFSSAPSVIMSPSIVGNPSLLTFIFQYDRLSTLSSIFVTGLSSVSFVSSPSCICSGIDTTDMTVALVAGSLNISFPISSGTYDDSIICTVKSVLPSASGILRSQIFVYSSLQGRANPVNVGSSQVIAIGVASQKTIPGFIDSNSQFKVAFTSQITSYVQGINIVFSPVGPSAVSSAGCYIGTTSLPMRSVSILDSTVTMTFQYQQSSLTGMVSCTLSGFQSGLLKMQDFIISPFNSGQIPPLLLAYIPGHILGQGFKGTGRISVVASSPLVNQETDILIQFRGMKSANFSFFDISGFTGLSLSDSSSCSCQNTALASDVLKSSPCSISTFLDTYSAHLRLSFSKKTTFLSDFTSCTITSATFSTAGAYLLQISVLGRMSEPLNYFASEFIISSTALPSASFAVSSTSSGLNTQLSASAPTGKSVYSFTVYPIHLTTDPSSSPCSYYWTTKYDSASSELIFTTTGSYYSSISCNFYGLSYNQNSGFDIRNVIVSAKDSSGNLIASSFVSSFWTKNRILSSSNPLPYAALSPPLSRSAVSSATCDSSTFSFQFCVDVNQDPISITSITISGLNFVVPSSSSVSVVCTGLQYTSIAASLGSSTILNLLFSNDGAFISSSPVFCNISSVYASQSGEYLVYFAMLSGQMSLGTATAYVAVASSTDTTASVTPSNSYYGSQSLSFFFNIPSSSPVYKIRMKSSMTISGYPSSVQCSGYAYGTLYITTEYVSNYGSFLEFYYTNGNYIYGTFSCTVPVTLAPGTPLSESISFSTVTCYNYYGYCQYVVFKSAVYASLPPFRSINGGSNALSAASIFLSDPVQSHSSTLYLGFTLSRQSTLPTQVVKTWSISGLKNSVSLSRDSQVECVGFAGFGPYQTSASMKDGDLQINFITSGNPSAPSLVLIDNHNVSDSEAKRYYFKSSSRGRIKITLAWTDPAASMLSSFQLVNDLDLIVVVSSGPTSPGGVYRGNSRLFETIGGRDYLNNNEQVFVDSVDESVEVVVVVQAYIMSPDYGPQSFSLASTGAC
jgi:hypothetical protein